MDFVLFYIQRRDRQIPRRGQHSDILRGSGGIVHSGKHAFQKFSKRGREVPMPYLAFSLLCLIGVLFAVFIFAPPYLPLLEDPITGT